MKTVDYANAYLFEPLGIKPHTNYLAETAEEHKHFTISKLPKEPIWFCDTNGLGTPGYGLCMSAEDMAKIGLLCLNKGAYNKKQVISANWIKEMTTPRTVEGNHEHPQDIVCIVFIVHVLPKKKISEQIIFLRQSVNLVQNYAALALNLCPDQASLPMHRKYIPLLFAQTL